MNSLSYRTVGLLIVLGAPVTLAACSAHEPSARSEAALSSNEDALSYEGKTIKLLVGFVAGGGYDKYARLTAEYLPRHLAGHPQIEVVNMPNTSAAAPTTAEMALALHQAPSDGLTLGSFYPTLPLQQRLGTPGISFDTGTFKYIGAPAGDPPACVIRAAFGATSWAQIHDAHPGPTIGNTGIGSPGRDIPRILNSASGSALQIAPAAPGTAKLVQDLNAGLIDGACWTWSTMRTALQAQLAAGTVVPFVAVDGIPALPNTPTVQQLVHGTAIASAIGAWAATADIHRLIAAPPGTSPAREAMLRDAYEATVHDQDFLAAAQQAGLDIVPVTGSAVQGKVEQMLALSDADATTLAAIIGP